MGIALEESIQESDHVEEVAGLTFLINERDQPYFQDGTVIRYVKSPFAGRGIQIDLVNPPNSIC